MRCEAIEMVCAHVPQSQEAPPHRRGVLGALVFRIPTWYHFNGLVSLYYTWETLQIWIRFVRQRFDPTLETNKQVF